MQFARVGHLARQLLLRPMVFPAGVRWNWMQFQPVASSQVQFFSSRSKDGMVHEPQEEKGNLFSTEDQRVIELSTHVKKNDVLASLRAYSKLPLFLPRSDFRIVCSLMQSLGKYCHIPDLENAFFKIQKMKLTRKHAITFRCLIRLACELHDTDLIENFYQSICEEEVYINNAFLNDIVVDALFSLDAYSSLCNVFDSMHVWFLNNFLPFRHF